MSRHFTDQQLEAFLDRGRRQDTERGLSRYLEDRPTLRMITGFVQAAERAQTRYLVPTHASALAAARRETRMKKNGAGLGPAPHRGSNRPPTARQEDRHEGS
jgi:hypothetical protein